MFYLQTKKKTIILKDNYVKTNIERNDINGKKTKT